MGIINVTPDSFSDGSQLKKNSAGRFEVDVDKALRRAEEMVEAGAMFVDIGGESTRPGAQGVCDRDQLERVIPVVEAVRRNLDVCISVDTSSATVMKAAIAAGAEMINDIRALSLKGAIETLRDTDVAICLMHIQGQPDTMQQTCHYHDIVEEVMGFLEGRVASCEQAGIARRRLLIDPGFGFGKSLAHNYQLLKHLSRFTELKLPLLVGVSRKSMIGGVVGRPVEQRLAGSVAATVHALAGGAGIIRTHDVAATLDAIRVHCAFQDA